MTYKAFKKTKYGVRGDSKYFKTRELAVKFLVKKYGTFATARYNGWEVVRVASK